MQQSSPSLSFPPRLLQTDHHRRIGLVLTGGTIASHWQGDGSLVELAKQQTPQLARILEKAQAGGIQFVASQPFHKHSEDLGPEDWLALAGACRSLAKREVQGILILHGTDSMSFSASALQLLLADLPLPVVLTGANLPADHPTGDAAKNIADSLLALEQLPAGVFVVFAGEPQLDSLIHLGDRIRKVQAGGSSFQSINSQPIGRVAQGRLELSPLIQGRQIPAGGRAAFDQRVLGIRLYPGLNFEPLQKALADGDYQALVVELYPSATGPKGLVELVQFCQTKNIPAWGTVNALPPDQPNNYPSSYQLQKAGLVLLGDRTWENSLVRAMWALAQDGHPGDWMNPRGLEL